MRSLASRYIAGEGLEDAIETLRGLADDGFPGIIDLLGEDVTSAEEARRVVEDYAAAARAVTEAGLDAYVSIKPTHLGLRISEELCGELYRGLLAHCAPLGRFVRVEMEDAGTTDATLRVYERLRTTSREVGIVLQSRLLRTPADIDRLAAGPVSVRMVKGIYLEPAEIAHVDPQPIRAAYLACARKLFERGARVSFATHDDRLASELTALVRERGIPRECYEFQVLLGVREELWRKWREQGHIVRVYVPFGPQWRAYSTRRLRKNPELFRHVLRDLFRPRR